jgi:uncharacterized protein YecT (DUF1311 family)
MQMRIGTFPAWLAALLLLGSSGCVRADTVKTSPAHLPSPRKPPATCPDPAVTPQDINNCAALAARAAAEKLSRSYVAVLCRLDPAARPLLESSERAWVAFRDSDCALWGGGGGAVAALNRLHCEARLSDERAKELDGWPSGAAQTAADPCE